MCPGCFKDSSKHYCADCRRLLFDGRKVKPILSFDAPGPATYGFFQENTRGLSVSGAQLKYSLFLEGDLLRLTDGTGQYILKPIPASTQLYRANQAPANEHLTMQIAARVFNIKTAANALINFNDGQPAYLTRRFDYFTDGIKFQLEDMAQLSGRSEKKDGTHYKYKGSYLEIAQLIQQFVVAYPPALEHFFRLVIFNYLFSNGDAHLKNFSLLQTSMGDYQLSPAYDLMSTVLHTPNESDTAIDLYPGDTEGTFFQTFGYYGLPEFQTLANKIGINPARATNIVQFMLSKKDSVLKLIGLSFLHEESKQLYAKAYLEKRERLTSNL